MWQNKGIKNAVCIVNPHFNKAAAIPVVAVFFVIGINNIFRISKLYLFGKKYKNDNELYGCIYLIYILSFLSSISNVPEIFALPFGSI